MSQLFLLSNVVRRERAIDQWFREQPDELGDIAREWFDVMRGCGADVRETLHDDQPTACVGDAAFGYVDAFTGHVNVGFFRGAELDDPAALLEGTGKLMRHVKLKPGAPVNRPALTALIQTAYAKVKALTLRSLAVFCLLFTAVGCSTPQLPPEGFIDVPGGKVFYTTMGGGNRTPLLLLHGGPGGRSCGFSVLSELGKDRRVIRYDQLGSGQSDRPDDLSLWTTARFVEELDAVRDALGLSEVHILGHSWGGTLATEYLLTKGQQGVRSVILSSPLISTPRWLADTRRLRTMLPADVQTALNKCEAVDTADEPACVEANEVFEEHFVRGAKTLPAVPECEGITGGDAVYRHMWGAGEFTATGLLRNYDRSDRLGELKLPVLFLAGRHDEAVPETIRDFQQRVPGARMAVFEKSAHATYRTETAEYVRIVRAFLHEADGARR